MKNHRRFQSSAFLPLTDKWKPISDAWNAGPARWCARMRAFRASASLGAIFRNRGLVGPSGFPAEAVKALEKVCLDIATKPEVVEALEKECFLPVTMGAEETRPTSKKIRRASSHWPRS